MFKIKSYLQYCNTPDGKPRVLVEGADYEYTDKKYLITDSSFLGLISKSDCRPLLTVKNSLPDSKWWTECDIALDEGQLKIVYMIEENGVYKMVGRKPSELWNDSDESFLYNCGKLGSFFDDPAKYSKMLWDCSEEEGLKKVLKLLNLKIKKL